MLITLVAAAVLATVAVLLGRTRSRNGGMAWLRAGDHGRLGGTRLWFLLVLIAATTARGHR